MHALAVCPRRVLVEARPPDSITVEPWHSRQPYHGPRRRRARPRLLYSAFRGVVQRAAAPWPRSCAVSCSTLSHAVAAAHCSAASSLVPADGSPWQSALCRVASVYNGHNGAPLFHGPFPPPPPPLPLIPHRNCASQSRDPRIRCVRPHHLRSGPTCMATSRARPSPQARSRSEVAALTISRAAASGFGPSVAARNSLRAQAPLRSFSLKASGTVNQAAMMTAICQPPGCPAYPPPNVRRPTRPRTAPARPRPRNPRHSPLLRPSPSPVDGVPRQSSCAAIHVHGVPQPPAQQRCSYRCPSRGRPSDASPRSGVPPALRPRMVADASGYLKRRQWRRLLRRRQPRLCR
jgi:hypothetical protein